VASQLYWLQPEAFVHNDLRWPILTQ
jgi:hypothetical protein